MNKDVKIEYLSKLSKLNGLNYLIAMILFGAAPTIKYIKPSNLITISTKFNMLELWLQKKELICDYLNLRYLSLREDTHSHTILFFNPKVLSNHLLQDENNFYLSQYGYNIEFKYQLEKLKANFNKKFPHEIGVFLGIPPMDVEGFTRNNGKNYLLNSYWKVYCNLKEALKLFDKFDQARIESIHYIDKSKDHFIK
ncbi:DUF3793 family protein [Alkalibaculum sporogenes]|nr:DUF3793 family protein [Alkalibaculum sporogenes]